MDTAGMVMWWPRVSLSRAFLAGTTVGAKAMFADGEFYGPKGYITGADTVDIWPM